jgi:sulfur carrier protein
MATETIEIVLNGDPRNVPVGLSVLALLGHLSVPADRVAVELNRQILRRTDWATQPVVEGSHVEIVHFVGGG